MSKPKAVKRRPASIHLNHHGHHTHHDHDHHNHNQEHPIHQKQLDDIKQSKLKKKYKKQLERLKSTYLKFLPKPTEYQLTVDSETRFGVVVQVKIFKNQRFDHSFSAVIHPKTGKVISTHASTRHENPKNKKNMYMIPTGQN